MKLPPPTIACLLDVAEGVMDSREPDCVIGRGEDDAAPYLQRWYMLRNNPTGPISNLYVHRFMRADGDEAVHDHPWDWTTTVLHGGYQELFDGRVFDRFAGDVVMRQAADAHLIKRVMKGTVTLFATGRKVRDWGFHTAHGWVPEPVFSAYKRAAASDNQAWLNAYFGSGRTFTYEGEDGA